MNVTYVNQRQDAREVRLDEGLVLQYREALLHAREIARKERSSIRDENVEWILQQPDVLTVTVTEGTRKRCFPCSLTRCPWPCRM